MFYVYGLLLPYLLNKDIQTYYINLMKLCNLWNIDIINLWKENKTRTVLNLNKINLYRIYYLMFICVFLGFRPTSVQSVHETVCQVTDLRPKSGKSLTFQLGVGRSTPAFSVSTAEFKIKKRDVKTPISARRVSK